MRLNYEYKGPSSVSQFGHYYDAARERKSGNLEQAVGDPQANFFIHVLFGGMIVKSRFGLPGISLDLGPAVHFSASSYFGFYVVEATKAIPRSRVLHPFLGETKIVPLGVEREKILPHQYADMSRPQHYAPFMVGVAEEVINKGKKVRIYASTMKKRTLRTAT